MMRKTPDAAYERVPLLRNEKGQYEGMLFDLAAPRRVLRRGQRRQLEALQPEGRRPALRAAARARISLPGLYRPAAAESRGRRRHRGLEGHRGPRSRAADDGAPGGQMVLGDKDRCRSGARRRGRVAGAAGRRRSRSRRTASITSSSTRRQASALTASPQYTIDALDDKPPTVSIAKPGRDTTASPIEEVFVEARAEDDFGVRDLDLVYSVNGGAEKTIRLFDGKKRMTEVSGGHTFYLEELDVKPGDFVSYYAKAADNDARAGLEAGDERHVLRARAPAEQGIPPRALGRRRRRRRRRRGQNQVGALSEQQRQIIAATFNVQRDRKKMTADKVRENSTVHRAVAVAAARSGRRAAHAHEQPAGRSRIPRSRRSRICCRRRSTEMKNAEAKLHAVSPTARCLPSRRRCSSCRRRKKSTRRRSRSSGSREAAVAAAAVRWRRISPTCSRWSSTRWPISTRRASRPRSSNRIRSSTN